MRVNYVMLVPLREELLSSAECLPDLLAHLVMNSDITRTVVQQ